MTRLPARRALLLALTLLASDSRALNTADIIASALSPSCLSWRISGICYWLYCTPVGCTVRTSVRVSHSLPDAVVTVHGQPANTPWSETAIVAEAALEAASTLFSFTPGGGNNEVKMHAGTDTRARKINMRFSDADVTGHPALAATAFTGWLSSIASYSCAGVSTPMLPYFLSPLDALVWRSGVPETLYPEALIPGRRELGSGSDNWGNLYPRGGFTVQENGYKAAAIVAQRAADIVTRTGQLHVYTPMTGTARDGYWPPDPVEENTGTTNHQWQRLTPAMTTSCAVFPDITGNSDFSAVLAEDDRYAWTLWRPYSCCQRRGQTLLYSTRF